MLVRLSRPHVPLGERAWAVFYPGTGALSVGLVWRVSGRDVRPASPRQAVVLSRWYHHPLGPPDRVVGIGLARAALVVGELANQRFDSLSLEQKESPRALRDEFLHRVIVALAEDRARHTRVRPELPGAHFDVPPLPRRDRRASSFPPSMRAHLPKSRMVKDLYMIL